jgi:hypothetical protein
MDRGSRGNSESSATTDRGEQPLPRRDLANKRALVVVDEKVSGKELRDSLLQHLEGGTTEVFVVAPALADSGFKHVMGDVDDAVEPARERLRTTLEELREAGVDARGEVGDSDPIQAIKDEIVKFEPEQVLVVAHSDEEAAFAEKGLLEQAERDIGIPVLELVVNRAREPEVLDVQSSNPQAEAKRGWRPSYNWPPLSKRDLAGILVAVIGTIVVGVLAAKGVANSHGNGNDHEENRLGAEAAAMVLIALGVALVNLAHVIGLFLFQSVHYEGPFNRFFARLSLFGTPAAIIASLILLAMS